MYRLAWGPYVTAQRVHALRRHWVHLFTFKFFRFYYSIFFIFEKRGPVFHNYKKDKNPIKTLKVFTIRNVRSLIL
jgi:hypothetical protein